MSATRCQCGLPKDPGYVCCRVCWRSVPIAIKRRLWQSAFQLKRPELHSNAPLRHRAAVRAVIEHLRAIQTQNNPGGPTATGVRTPTAEPSAEEQLGVESIAP